MGKFWQVIFWVADLTSEFFWVFKTIGIFVQFLRTAGRVVPLKFLWLGNSAWDIFGLNFGPGIFLGFI